MKSITQRLENLESKANVILTGRVLYSDGTTETRNWVEIFLALIREEASDADFPRMVDVEWLVSPDHYELPPAGVHAVEAAKEMKSRNSSED